MKNINLYSWQKELLESKEKSVLINWCREAGSDTALAFYILENKPKKTIICNDYPNAIMQRLNENLNYFGAFIEKINKEDYILTFNGSDKVTYIINTTTTNIRGTESDLLINKGSFFIDENHCKYKKMIWSLTTNESSLGVDRAFCDGYIVVDYKKYLSETVDLNYVDTLIKVALNSKNKLTREYALLDKPEKDEMSFSEFSIKALSKLQSQFLSIPDTKDTVLTRKNIIEMIKDLKQLNN